MITYVTNASLFLFDWTGERGKFYIEKLQDRAIEYLGID